VSDLTTQEQAHVRAALRFLRAKCGGWRAVGKVLRVQRSTLGHALSKRTISASLAVRVARFVGVGVDDLLTGQFPPPGTCPHCGQQSVITGK
jgi:hypothetical protein